MTLKTDAKFEEKLTYGLENDTRNLVNCHHSNWKSQNWDLDETLWFKVKNAWAKSLYTEDLYTDNEDW